MRSDPIGFKGGINCYVYADNSQPNLVDPFGLAVVNVWRPGDYTDSDGKTHQSDFGHASITSDSGEYLSHHPRKHGWNPGKSKFRTPEEDRALYGREPDFQYYIKLPNEKGLDVFINDEKKNNDYWGPFGNCVDAVTNGLNAGGYPAPDFSKGWRDSVSYPEELIGHFKELEYPESGPIRDVTVTCDD